MESDLTRTSTSANHPSVTTLFCTDSKSLSSNHLSYHQILVPPQFTNSINSISSSIFIQWIPGNSSIPGNKLANKEAKEATYIDTNTILPVSKQIKNRKDDLLSTLVIE